MTEKSMLIYIAATVLTVLLCLWLYPGKQTDESGRICNPDKKENYRMKMIISCVIAMLPLFLVMGCRWNVGVDTWHTYTPDYLAMKSESVPLSGEEEELFLKSVQVKNRLYGYTKEAARNFPLEGAYKEHRTTYHHTAPGFQMLEKILIFIHADVQWLYIVTSLIIMGFVFASIWQQSTRPALACLFFVITANFFLAMNIVSQYMAIAVCLFACTYAEKRKPFLFFLLVAMAATFHISALVFIPVYFLPKLRIKPIWCIAVIAVSLLVDRFAFPLILRLMEDMPKYAHYLSRDTAEFEWVFFAIGCAVFALGTYYYPKAKDLPWFRLWYYMNVLGLMALAFSGHIPLMKRINYYFAAPHFLLIPLLLNLEERPFLRKALHVVTISLFCAMIAVAIGKMNKHATLPYQAFFQKDRAEVLDEYIDHLPGMWD